MLENVNMSKHFADNQSEMFVKTQFHKSPQIGLQKKVPGSPTDNILHTVRPILSSSKIMSADKFPEVVLEK